MGRFCFFVEWNVVILVGEERIECCNLGIGLFCCGEVWGFVVGWEDGY